MSDQPPYRWASDEPDDDTTEPVRRSGIAVAALVLGVLAIPLALTVYLGALTGLLGLLLGLLGMYRTRAGRTAGRGMAVAGVVAGLTGVALALALGVLSWRTYQDCEARVGHKPTRVEWDDCVHGRR